MEEKIDIVVHKMDGSEIRIPVVVSDNIPENEIYVFDSSDHVYKIIGLVDS